MQIINSRHPTYNDLYTYWCRWRYVYAGGDEFIENYLTQISSRETVAQFYERKNITYCPAFAASAINEIKNAIFQRTGDISRVGGSLGYSNAVLGLDGGVDLQGSKMNTYVGRQILPDLLTIGKVGIFVDSPAVAGITRAETRDFRPYIYKYAAEDILNWQSNDSGYTSLLLRDNVYVTDEHGLPTDYRDSYRFLQTTADGVMVTIYDDKNSEEDSYMLPIQHIPFVVFELSDSLLKNIDRYQISLMNLASSDMSYAIRANFPFYTEQFDPRVDLMQSRPGGTDATADTAKTSAAREVVVGVMSGRRYPIGTDRPEFVNPSPEPLEVSMEKEKQLKEEIRQLVALNVSNLSPAKQASAESKAFDVQGLEAGLSYIGIELEAGERLIAEYWSMYEGSRPASIMYPQKYSLRTEEERREEATDLKEISNDVPSVTFKKEIAKQIAEITLGHKISFDTLNKIKKEIDEAKGLDSNPENIRSDIEIGILSLETAAGVRGYDKAEVKQAKTDHAERIARIQAAQSGARGLDPTDSDGSAKKEKQDSQNPDMDIDGKKRVRGDAAN